jgi:hypothetical protein
VKDLLVCDGFAGDPDMARIMASVDAEAARLWAVTWSLRWTGLDWLCDHRYNPALPAAGSRGGVRSVARCG